LIAKIESAAATNIMRPGGQHTIMDLYGDIRGKPVESYAPSFPVFDPTVQAPAGAAHIPVGRDPRSPSTGTGAYFPPSTPAEEIHLPQWPQQPKGQPQPQGPQAVNVSGEAQVEHEVTVRIEPSPLLTAIVEQARAAVNFTVPLIGGGSGRMDSDAGPHRSGGIGSM
jgi:hypothetical protein